MHAVLTRYRHVLWLTAAAAAWGIATVISKRAVAEIPPLTLLPIQLAASLLVLAGALITRRRRVDRGPELRRLGVLGVLNPGVSYLLSLIGLTYITASLSVLLWATEPVLILVLAWWLLGDRITGPMASASVLAFTGVILVVFEGGEGQPVGIALTLAGIAACAVYTVLSRKLITTETTLEVVAVQQACALMFAVLLLGIFTLTGQAPARGVVQAGSWAAAVTSGILYYAVAFWLYLNGLRRVDAGIAGMFINLIPVFGVAASHALLDERLTTRQWTGAVVILIAVGLIVGRVSGERNDRVDLDEELGLGQ